MSLVADCVLCQQESIDEAAARFEQDHQCHVYIVCRRPRVGIDPASVEITASTIRGVFWIQRQDRQDRYDFSAKNNLGSTDIEVECGFPYSEIYFRCPERGVIGGGKVPFVLSRINIQHKELFPLEVLYVGQAFGDGGSRTAADRLSKHETLQAIHAEVNRQSPDQEIWLVLVSLKPYSITRMGMFMGPDELSPEEELRRALVGSSPGVSEQQQINFGEAALIRYFSPRYNVAMKKSFPNPAHQTYRECYDVDMNAVVVELDTTDIWAQLYSEAVSPRWLHMIQFELHTREKRMSIFDWEAPFV